MIFETHAHYDDRQFDKDREELLSSMREQGIDKIVNIGADMDTTRWTMKAIETYPFMYGAVGVHPNSTGEMTEGDIDELKNYSQHEKVVAIGEIGLDYYWDEPERPIQKNWFEAQLELARDVSLPVVIHSRDAAKDTLDMMESLHAGDIGGVIHCFSYGVDMAKKYLDMGFYIGVGGVVTFKNGKKLKEVVEYAPLESIVLETDSPYLSPEPNRGKRNSSLNLHYVAEEIARIKGITKEEVVSQTEINAMKMYQIKGI